MAWGKKVIYRIHNTRKYLSADGATSIATAIPPPTERDISAPMSPLSANEAKKIEAKNQNQLHKASQQNLKPPIYIYIIYIYKNLFLHVDFSCNARNPPPLSHTPTKTGLIFII